MQYLNFLCLKSCYTEYVFLLEEVKFHSKEIYPLKNVGHGAG